MTRKEDNAYFIIVLYSRERKCSCYFCHHIFFHLLFHGTKVQTVRDIDKQHHCQLTLFFKYLDKWFVKTGRYIPVYITYIVTILIFQGLREKLPRPLKAE